MMRFGLKYYEILNKKWMLPERIKRLFHIQQLSSDELRAYGSKIQNDQPGDTLYDQFSKTRKQINCIYTDWAKMMLSGIR